MTFPIYPINQATYLIPVNSDLCRTQFEEKVQKICTPYFSPFDRQAKMPWSQIKKDHFPNEKISAEQISKLWDNRLNPYIKNSVISDEDTEMIFSLIDKYGTSWSDLSKKTFEIFNYKCFYPANAIKNQHYQKISREKNLLKCEYRLISRTLSQSSNLNLNQEEERRLEDSLEGKKRKLNSQDMSPSKMYIHKIS